MRAVCISEQWHVQCTYSDHVMELRVWNQSLQVANNYMYTLHTVDSLDTCTCTCTCRALNPFGTVDGYSSSLRDATGPVDEYSHIPTSTQVTCIAACVYMYMCTCTHVTMHKYCIIVHVVHVHVHVVVKFLITSTWVRHGDPLSWPLGKNTGKLPSVCNLIPSARG